MTDIGTFAGIAVALYAAHHVGDYWVQTDHQSTHKGKKGVEGQVECAKHVVTYTITQLVLLLVTVAVFSVDLNPYALYGGLLFSAVTHYAADRREFGIMFKLARLIPGKANFLRLGVPRDARVIEAWFDCASCEGRGTGGQASDESTNGRCWDCRGGGKLPSSLTITDNPSLGTGAWALDQSWHILLGVFFPALIICI